MNGVFNKIMRLRSCSLLKVPLHSNVLRTPKNKYRAVIWSPEIVNLRNCKLNLTFLGICANKPGHVVKLTRGAGCTRMWSKRDCEFVSRVCEVFSPNFPRGIVNSGICFRIAQVIRRFHYTAQVRRRKAGEEKRVRNILSSTWTRTYRGTTAVATRGIAHRASGRKRRDRAIN